MSAATAPASVTPLLVELRAAISAGAAPSAALVEAHRRHPDALPELEPAARAVALGASLDRSADDLRRDTDVAGLLVRALAVAERAGTGALAAVEQAERAVRAELDLARRLRVRTAQARGSLRVLMAVPAGAVVFFLLIQPAAFGFYRLRAGQLTAVCALGLMAAARAWARRIVAQVPAAAAAADPLGAAAGGGAAEVAELLAVALAAGLPPIGAVRLVAAAGPPAGRPVLHAAERGLGAGLPVDAAFADTPLAAMGAALAAAQRWGGPAQDILRDYAATLRADRRAALEEAAERAELRLVFPTTLLTLPSFLVAVVPPLVWTGLRP